MPKYRVWFPLGSLDVEVEAESEEQITDEMVIDATLEEHGKYISRDIRFTCIDDWHVEEEIEP